MMNQARPMRKDELRGLARKQYENNLMTKRYSFMTLVGGDGPEEVLAAIKKYPNFARAEETGGIREELYVFGNNCMAVIGDGAVSLYWKDAMPKDVVCVARKNGYVELNERMKMNGEPKDVC